LLALIGTSAKQKEKQKERSRKTREEEGTNVDAEVRNRRRSSLWKLCLLCEICMMFDSASLYKTEENGGEEPV
jgi:hypothetical protein